MYFLLIVPVIVLIYTGKGITVGDFFLIQGIYRIAGFLFEVPSGYMSDVFSRKKVMLLGAVVMCLSFLWIWFATGFWGILAGECGLGLAAALFSGTKEAYAFDLLKRMGREKQFLKENGSINTWAQAGSFIAAAIGAWLYTIIGDWIMGVEALVAALGVLCVLWLPELTEVRRKVAPEASPWRDVMGIVKMSVAHPEIKWFMLFPAIFGGFTIILIWMVQPAMAAAGIAVGLFGLFIGLNQFSRLVFSKSAHKILKFLGNTRLMWCLAGGLILGIGAAFAGLLGAGNMWLIYPMFAIFAVIPASQSMSGLVFNNYIHHRIKSTERGTVLSVSAMYKNFISGAMLMAVKPLMDGVGIYWTLAIVLIFVAILIWPILKISKIKGM
ncbi:MFS transporter [Bacteroidia bacterium]|nr:MFS transporter [Bacteroidia bacterium]